MAKKACKGMPKAQVVEAVVMMRAEKPVSMKQEGELKRLALARLYSAEIDGCYISHVSMVYVEIKLFF